VTIERGGTVNEDLVHQLADGAWRRIFKFSQMFPTKGTVGQDIGHVNE
jgi:hypothetical protein